MQVTFHSALHTVYKKCWFTSMNLNDAYYSVNMSEAYPILFYFVWKGYQIWMHMSSTQAVIGSAAVYKISQTVVFIPQTGGYWNVAYSGDSLLRFSCNSCLQILRETITLVDSSGLTIHSTKSAIVHLEQCYNFGKPHWNKNRLIENGHSISIRHVHLIVKMVASAPKDMRLCISNLYKMKRTVCTNLSTSSGEEER